ncbi:lipopolysaccharide biosynthesis protein [methane-oxidizing endosymbiont of Gigantopelta aegis]|uniref:lipopolysaccharide biosynthesis protein n=1 Tax=methane-oxidizing endosymbiont of Gigantopelta aegis TaxID=2794938 RepID=UPI0018DE2CE0|nr:lipopolysaccharide biosynthesis protein [methane-oxidizing endosymbiont of Gigantopelta aegis]
MFGWSAFEQFFRMGIQFAVMLVLARILTPEDFGLFAMLAIFIAITSTVANAGLPDAIIQSKSLTIEEVSSIFFLSLIILVISSCLLATSAPLIAIFFKRSLLENITYVMALAGFVGGLGMIQSALLSRELNFKAQGIISAISSLVSGMIAITFALNGWGVWSLVYATLIGGVVSSVLLWFYHPWRPRLFFNVSLIQSHIKYGTSLLFARLINVVIANLPATLLSKFYTPQEVGLFNRANSLQNLSVNTLSGIAAKVAFPLFAHAADDSKRLERGMNKALKGTLLITMPVAVFMILLAEPIIKILLGNQWLECIPLLQILSFQIIIWPLHLLNVNLLMAVGRSDLIARGVMIKFVVVIASLSLGVKYGLLGLAIAMLFFKCRESIYKYILYEKSN